MLTPRSLPNSISFSAQYIGIGRFFGPLHIEGIVECLTIYPDPITKEPNTPTSLYKRVSKDLKWHTLQYRFVACVANGFLGLQIVLGATLTALGANKKAGVATAIVILGALQTVIAGFLTYFKSRSQPNRARHFHNDLRRVMFQLDETVSIFCVEGYHDDPFAAFLRIEKQYEDAVTDAKNNYPDQWTVRPLKD